MMREHNGLIAFRKRGLLSQKKFEQFLELARRIAVFDPETKKWKISLEKLGRLNASEVRSILDELREYTDLDDEKVEAILSLYSVEYIEKCARVAIDKKLVVRECAEKLREIIETENLKTLFEERGRFLLVRSILYLPRIREVLQRHGIEVRYDEKMTTAVFQRLNGKLYVSFYRIDKPLYKLLSSLGTLVYNEERVKLGPSKEYMGTELIKRKLRVYNIDWRRGVYDTSIGLLKSIEKTLSNYGFHIVKEIEELPDLKLKLEKKFALYPHQEEALRLWLRERRGTIAIFTRGGKSFIALGAIYSLRKPTLILVPTRELVYTWTRYLNEYLGVPRGLIGRLGGGEKLVREITVSTYSSAVKYIEELKGRFELAIFDEAHHVPASTFKEVALNIDSLYRMALSATPRRRDGNEGLLYALCGELIYTLTYADLLKLKMVAPIEVFETIFAVGEDDKLKRLLDILDRHKDAKTIIFTQRLATAEKIFNTLKGRMKVELITGETPSIKREMAFKKFLDGRVNIIVTTTVLDEGITVPDAEVAIIYEGSGEARQMIQRIGRVIGYHPGKTAKIYELVDVNNPREKNAYRRRSWVRELYMVEGLDKYVKYVKEGKEDEIRPSYQYHIDAY